MRRDDCIVFIKGFQADAMKTTLVKFQQISSDTAASEGGDEGPIVEIGALVLVAVWRYDNRYSST